jgi:NAD-specific glutamate dehydrogenase
MGEDVWYKEADALFMERDKSNDRCKHKEDIECVVQHIMACRPHDFDDAIEIERLYARIKHLPENEFYYKLGKVVEYDNMVVQNERLKLEVQVLRMQKNNGRISCKLERWPETHGKVVCKLKGCE